MLLLCNSNSNSNSMADTYMEVLHWSLPPHPFISFIISFIPGCTLYLSSTSGLYTPFPSPEEYPVPEGLLGMAHTFFSLYFFLFSFFPFSFFVSLSYFYFYFYSSFFVFYSSIPVLPPWAFYSPLRQIQKRKKEKKEKKKKRN